MNGNFEITVQRGFNNQGTIKKLDGNYYQVVLGALEFPNSVGAVYDTQSAINIIENNGLFKRRITTGALYGELGHPSERDSKDYNDFVRRIHTIDERNIGIHFRRVWIDPNYVGSDGKKIVAILGEVCGAGPHAAMFDRAMQNPHENVAFSVRSMTNDRIVGGVKRKYFDTIVTWDLILGLPGIATATKFNSPSCESAVVLPITPAVIKVMEDSTKPVQGVALEAYQVSMESSLEAIRMRKKSHVSRGRSALEAW